MTDKQAYRKRMAALAFAIDYSRINPVRSYEEVLEMAKAFDDFLEGDARLRTAMQMQNEYARYQAAVAEAA